MKAKECAEILLRNPEAEVRVTWESQIKDPQPEDFKVSTPGLLQAEKIKGLGSWRKYSEHDSEELVNEIGKDTEVIIIDVG